MIKNNEKCALTKRFHHDHWIQVYMFDFIYVDTVTMPEEYYFPATGIFFENYNKRATPGPIPKHWLGFSYIGSEDYELDLYFDEN